MMNKSLSETERVYARKFDEMKGSIKGESPLSVLNKPKPKMNKPTLFDCMMVAFAVSIIILIVVGVCI